MNCFGEDGLQHASDMVFDRAIAPRASLVGGCFQSGGCSGGGVVVVVGGYSRLLISG